MKIIASVGLMFLVCSTHTSAWFGGGGSSSSSNKGSDNNSGGKTTADAGVEASKDGGVKASGGVSHEGDGWKGGVKGTVDSNGDWGVEAGVSVEIGKRSIALNGEHYSVRLDPCNFGMYDGNRDGVILKSEMVALFGEHSRAEDLFEALDITTGTDGQSVTSTGTDGRRERTRSLAQLIRDNQLAYERFISKDVPKIMGKLRVNSMMNELIHTFK